MFYHDFDMDIYSLLVCFVGFVGFGLTKAFKKY